MNKKQTLQPKRPDSTTRQLPLGSSCEGESCDAASNPVAVKRDQKIEGNASKLKLIPGPSSSKFFGGYRTYVDHTYRDCSMDPNPEEYKRPCQSEKFPTKFHMLIDFAMRLEKPVRDRITGTDVLLREVIYWKPHGRAFVMAEKYKLILESHLLEMFFKSSKCKNLRPYFLNYLRYPDLCRLFQSSIFSDN